MAKKRIFAIMLAMSMVLTLLPATAFAAEGEPLKTTLPQELLTAADNGKTNDANNNGQELINDTFDALNPNQAPAEDKTVEDVADKGENDSYTARGEVLTEAGDAKQAYDEAEGLIGTANAKKGLAETAKGTAQGALTAAKDAIEEAVGAIQTAEGAKAEAEKTKEDAAKTAGEAAEEIESDTTKAKAVEDALKVETEDGKKSVADVIAEQQVVINEAVSEAASAAVNGDVEAATAARDKAQDAVDTANGAYEQAQDSFVNAVKDILGDDFDKIDPPDEDASDADKAAYNNALIEAAQNALQAKYSSYNQTITSAKNQITDANDKITTANTAIGTANAAIGTANTAIGTANAAIGNANTAVDAANDAINGTENQVGANAQVTAAVEKLDAAKQALADAEKQKNAAEQAKAALDRYVKLLEDTQANPKAVEELKTADGALTAAKEDTKTKKDAADAKEPEGSTAATTADRLLRDSELKSSWPAIKNAQEIIHDAVKIIDNPNSTEEQVQAAMKRIFEEEIYDAYAVKSRTPYMILVKDKRPNHGTDTKNAIERLILNLDVLQAEYAQQEKQEAYNKAEKDLKDKLIGENVNEKDVIAAVKGLGELQEANEALEQHQKEAEDAQAKVESAIKAYEAAKGAVSTKLNELTTTEGAIQLETQDKLASMLTLNTMNVEDIQKITDDLKGVEDTQVQGVLAQLRAALANLAKAQAAKDEAEEAKKEADQAVEEAERRRQEIIDSSTGGDDTGDTGDTGDTDVPDADVPMTESPDTGDDTDVEIQDPEVPLAGVATRGEFLNYLYEREGAPETELSTFADVPADHPYAKAIGWAQAKGLVVGYGDGNFGPDDPVNYSAVRIILTKYAAYLNIDMPELATLAGEDNSPVFNCTDVLKEFFGE